MSEFLERYGDGCLVVAAIFIITAGILVGVGIDRATRTPRDACSDACGHILRATAQSCECRP